MKHYDVGGHTACQLTRHSDPAKILIWTTKRSEVDCQACLRAMYPRDPNRRRSWRRHVQNRTP